MRRLPTWVKIVIPIFLLVLLITAAGVKLVLEQVPAHATPSVVAERFAEQLSFLRTLSTSLPFGGCDPAPLDDPTSLIDSLDRWRELAAEGDELLADPAILGAEITLNCGGELRSYGIKSYGGLTWSFTGRAREWPSTSLCFAGAGRSIRYEERVPDSSPDPLVVTLMLDLDRL